MKIRIGRLVASAVALSAAAVMATTGTASAATAGYHLVTASGVKVQIWEHGDVVKVTDTSANGHSAYVTVMYTYQGRDFSYNMTAKSKGSSKTHRASDGGVYNLPENARIDIEYDGNGGNFSSKHFVNDH
ncbi:hypothetical protein [Actinomadura violacea]|uniref:Uncharacterized protein n=1 Tax=Actinomadura violacea TaxID=2819934 RepID=A0ABS3RWY2_9ACTN|nr:hypothetical protein [Actinomadura violacea]MBO2461261.1 hypothetical protein [Actinomadura violacea]